MSEDDLKAIEARAEAATPGPWEREHGIIWGDSGRQKVAYSGALTHDIGTLEFIAAARQDVPALLADREELVRKVCTACDGSGYYGTGVYSAEGSQEMALCECQQPGFYAGRKGYEELMALARELAAVLGDVWAGRPADNPSKALAKARVAGLLEGES